VGTAGTIELGGSAAIGDTAAMPAAIHRLRALGERTIGTLPAMWVAGDCVAIAILATILLPQDQALVVEIGCLLVVLAYCALRPADGLTVLGLAVMPAAAGALVGDGFGIPRWTIAAPVAAIALIALAAQDRDDRASRADAAVQPSDEG
jgi:hypothetical protein